MPVPAAEFSHAWLTFRPNNVPESIFRCSWCFETHDNLMLTVTCNCLLQVAVENQVRTLRHRWELVKRGDLLGFLAAPTGVEMSPQLEASVAEMARCLKSLFSVLFCTSQGEPFISQQLLATISQIKELLQTRLADYEDYLLVKGRRNMTMTAYPFATSSNNNNDNNNLFTTIAPFNIYMIKGALQLVSLPPIPPQGRTSTTQ